MTDGGSPNAPVGAGILPVRGGRAATVAARPYPWPWDAQLTPNRVALLLVAPQRWWLDRCPTAATTLRALELLRDRLTSVGGVTVLTRHIAAGPPTVPSVTRGPRHGLPVEGTADADLVVDPVAATVVTACGHDAFRTTDLDGILRGLGRDLLLVCGLGLEGPVHSTLRSANDRGYECLLVADGCAAADPELAAAAAHIVTMSGGIFGAVANLTGVAAALAALPAPISRAHHQT